MIMTSTTVEKKMLMTRITEKKMAVASTTVEEKMPVARITVKNLLMGVLIWGLADCPKL